MINLIIKLLAVIGVDENGWVSVERPKKAPVQNIEEDDSVWPVFVRKFGEDRILIRFPVDPSYKYLDKKIEIEAEHSGALHKLSVEGSEMGLEREFQKLVDSLQENGDALVVLASVSDEYSADLLYKLGSKWVRERMIAVGERIYRLQTFSETLNVAQHEKFASSFDLEIRDENRVFHRVIAT
ncbi:MAG: hypothetical protein JSS32_02580 [Verrucomicrobia bacterium]|nr:hypothetical protein [Verrucomicrobiota bacterium]